MNDGKTANDQFVRTAPIRRGWVIISWYLYGYFIAIYRSKLIIANCCTEAMMEGPRKIDSIYWILQKPDAMLPLRRYICLAINTGWPNAPVNKSVPAKQANSPLYLFLSRGVVLTAIITRVFKNMVHGDRSRLMIVSDISMADISLVRKLSCHSGIPVRWRRRKLQLCNWSNCNVSFEEFIFLFAAICGQFKSRTAFYDVLRCWLVKPPFRL